MTRWIVAALAGACLAAGCATKQTAAQPKPEDVKATVVATQQRIEAVKNDASIPDSVKGQIIGRLQGNIDRTLRANSQSPPTSTTQ